MDRLVAEVGDRGIKNKSSISKKSFLNILVANLVKENVPNNHTVFEKMSSKII